MKRTEIKTIADLFRWEPYLSEGVIEDLLEVSPPAVFRGKSTPESLDHLTLEELCHLQDGAANNRLIYAAMEVLHGATEEETDKMPALAVVGIRNMVASELDRIAGLFSLLHREFTAPEILAGAEQLNFGMFGLADWYARRMGITNHDEAFRTPWLRIYQCRKNDLEMEEYKARLQEHQLAAAKHG